MAFRTNGKKQSLGNLKEELKTLDEKEKQEEEKNLMGTPSASHPEPIMKVSSCIEYFDVRF